jgi:hypothetical protein
VTSFPFAFRSKAEHAAGACPEATQPAALPSRSSIRRQTFLVAARSYRLRITARPNTTTTTAPAINGANSITENLHCVGA